MVNLFVIFELYKLLVSVIKTIELVKFHKYLKLYNIINPTHSRIKFIYRVFLNRMKKKTSSSIICENFKIPQQTIFQDYKCSYKSSLTYFGRLYVG